MNRAWKLAAGVSRRQLLAWSAAVGVAGWTGCKNTAENVIFQSRSQIGEDSSEADAVVTVGAKTVVSNTEPLVVNGVGLVYMLAGTGSSPQPDGWRAMLEQNLKKMKRDQPINIKELLDNPERTTSLVLVSALVPPGVRKGDAIDVQVTLPDGSKTTSLQGGVLFPCELFTADTTGNVRSWLREGTPAEPSGRLLRGDVWAEARGPLVAGNFVPETGSTTAAPVDNEGKPAYRAGFIAGGGTVIKTRPYHLILNQNEQSSRIAASIAARINSVFHTTHEPNLKIAEAKTPELILLNVPLLYRHNHYRFLLVARQIPYNPVRPDSPYRQKLEEELMDPATTLTAAVKLEALGGDCRDSLRIGLESPSPWVRFAAAEALAYLGQNDGAAELARLAEDHPALRVQCLKALATIDDAISTDRLVEMLSSSDPELRQGAFIALRLADERHPALNPTLMNRSYWLHRLAPEAAAAVHLSTSGRSEILVFGDGVRLRGPVQPFAVGTEFTVSWPNGDKHAKVTRIVKGRDEAEVREVRCAPTLVAILGAMANLGGNYSDAIELVRRAHRAELLHGELVVDAIPRELSIQQLAQYAKTDSTLARANLDVAKVGTVRPAVDAHGFEVPTVAEEPITPVGAPIVRPPLNRDPGRLFGPRRTPDTPILDPAVVPAGGQ